MAKKDKSKTKKDLPIDKDDMVSKNLSSLKGDEKKKGIEKLRERLHAKQALAKMAKQPRI